MVHSSYNDAVDKTKIKISIKCIKNIQSIKPNIFLNDMNASHKKNINH